ncbi:MAG: glycosyltransferase family 39 protein [Chloroflexia bacterium]
MPARPGALGLWLVGTCAYAPALAGTLLLRDEAARGWGCLMLAGAALLALAAWGRVDLPPLFSPAARDGVVGGFGLRRKSPYGEAAGAAPAAPGVTRRLLATRRWLAPVGIAGAVALSGLAGLRYLDRPEETFGLAGWLWLLSMALLLASAIAWPRRKSTEGRPASAWPAWEIAVFLGLVLVAALLRLWDLQRFPDNIFGDEIVMGNLAAGAYLGRPGPSVFSTLWPGVNLPALWFLVVAGSLKAGGVTLWALKLPAVLFGAAMAVPFYALVRNAWGRTAAIFGTAVLAFSAVDVHYSRISLNNILTPFFWAACFFFLLRALRSGRPAYWVCAGLVGGLSEYGYYGTRLLPFILAAFLGYLLVVHRKEARRYLGGFGLLALGYLVAFGPLLAYYAQHPAEYLGRGFDMLTWNHIPASWEELGQMWSRLRPLLADDLLGFSTHGSQDLVYFAPLLLPAEAALLVLGAALLVWHWRHPAAFLILLSGCAVLLVGGVLALYPGSFAPYLAHWTPAFPAIYATLALPVGIWLGQTRPALPGRLGWLAPAALVACLAALGWMNISFYFHDYYAAPAMLRSDDNRAAQRRLELRTAESRYQAALGPGYTVRIVGQANDPQNPDTRYLVSGQDVGLVADPDKELRRRQAAGKPLAFILLPPSQRYRDQLRTLYPGGLASEIRNHDGEVLFYTYIVGPP